jgi:hypothetical protein
MSLTFDKEINREGRVAYENQKAECDTGIFNDCFPFRVS